METYPSQEAHTDESAESSQIGGVSAKLFYEIQGAASIAELHSLAILHKDLSDPKNKDVDILISARMREMMLSPFSIEIRQEISGFIQMIEQSSSPEEIRKITDNCREWTLQLTSLGDNPESKQNTLMIVIEIAASRRLLTLLFNYDNARFTAAPAKRSSADGRNKYTV